ncbi:MAG: hypothetical protein J0M12_02140, partial [Deltaproteobacteria bacterium]|nr:hypothetical protein [Deltaproteobacteria bacterium]
MPFFLVILAPFPTVPTWSILSRMTLPIKRTIALKDICAHVSGRLQGDPEIGITGVCALDEQIAGCLCFAKNSADLSQDKPGNRAAAFLVPEDFELPHDKNPPNLIFVKDPFAALVTVIPFFCEPIRPAQGISPKADIDPSAIIGKNVSIGSFAVISARVQIGENCVIHPNVTIYPDVKIGANTTVHSGAVIRETCSIGSNSVIHG